MKKFFFKPKSDLKTRNDKKYYLLLSFFSLFALAFSVGMLQNWINYGWLFFLALSIGCAVISAFTGLEVLKYLYQKYVKKSIK